MAWDLLQQLRVSFFNQEEEIFSSIAEKLLKNPTLRPTWILVPDQATKNSILEELTLSYGIVFLNVTVTNFSNGLACLLKKSSSFDFSKLPSKSEIAVKLYLLFRKKLQKQIPDHLVAKKAAQEASILFSAFRYIKKTSLKGKTLANWQAFFPNNDLFSDALNSDLSIKKNSLQVIVAGIGELTEMEIGFLQNLSQYVPVDIFAYTSSAMFHQDFLSKNQKKRLFSALKEENTSSSATKELFYYLDQQNSLLANNGKMQRALLDKLDSLHPQIFDPHHFLESKPITLLQHIQKDILLAEEKQEAQKIEEKEPSLLLVQCNSKREEVEALYRLLQNTFLSDKTLQPKDVVVFSTDLREYSSYIEAVFSCDESKFPIYLELPAPKSLFVEAFLTIAKLPLTRVDNKTIISLLENKYIQKLLGLKKAQVQKCKQWVREGAMRFGWDKKHKKMWIEKSTGRTCQIPQEDAGTWERGQRRLLNSLLKIEQKEFLLSVERGDLPSLEAFFKLLDLLRSHCDFVQEIPKRSVQQWIGYLHLLHQKISSFTQENHEDNLFLSSWTFSFCEEEPISYEAFFYLFESQEPLSSLRKKTNVNTIRFHPLREEPLCLAKIVCYLGCQEDGSQALEESSFLSEDLFCLIPSKKQKMRSHFLRLLSSVKKGAYFFSSSEQGHFLPFVQELEEYVNKRYKTSSIKRTFSSHLSEQSFTGSIFDSSFLSDNKAAKALRRQKRFLPPKVFLYPQKNDTAFYNIALEDLANFLVHPAKFYIRSKLGLYFDEEDPIQENAPLSLDPLSLWKERELSFEKLLKKQEHALSDEEATGVFWSAAKQELLEFSWLTTNAFREKELEKSAFKELLIGEGEHQDAEAFTWEYEKSAVKLFGKIPRYNNGTFVINSAFSEEKWLKALPILAIIHFAKIHPQPKAFFLKDKKTFTFSQDTNSEVLLKSLLTFYIEGQKRCLPLLPKVALELAFGNLLKAEDKMKKSFYNFFKPDPYLLWAFPEAKVPNLQEYKLLYQPFLHTIFKHYLQGKRETR